MMALKGVFGSLRKWSMTAVTAIIASGLTLIATSYMDFLKTNHSIAVSDFENLNATSTELYQLLLAYSNMARTGAPVDEITQRRFAEAVLKLDSEARVISMRDPRAKEEFSEYENALLSLKEAADHLQGPLNGKEFVESASRYLVAQSKFMSTILQAQESFFSGILDASARR
jgi:hypothetical protein